MTEAPRQKPVSKLQYLGHQCHTESPITFLQVFAEGSLPTQKYTQVCEGTRMSAGFSFQVPTNGLSFPRVNGYTRSNVTSPTTPSPTASSRTSWGGGYGKSRIVDKDNAPLSQYPHIKDLEAKARADVGVDISSTVGRARSRAPLRAWSCHEAANSLAFHYTDDCPARSRGTMYEECESQCRAQETGQGLY